MWVELCDFINLFTTFFAKLELKIDVFRFSYNLEIFKHLQSRVNIDGAYQVLFAMFCLY